MKKRVKFGMYTIDYYSDEYNAYFDVHEETEVPDELELIGQGWVKWDGCSNWTFNQSDVAIHFCERNDMLAFGEMMANCYDLAKQLIEGFDG